MPRTRPLRVLEYSSNARSPVTARLAMTVSAEYRWEAYGMMRLLCANSSP
ncbi:MAG: hypothetical protein KA746_15190 [Pyrinomonadaceae bacterium]|nr:hypothetical protein [Pyrinomonadaceae bacterium]